MGGCSGSVRLTGAFRTLIAALKSQLLSAGLCSSFKVHGDDYFS